MLHTPFYDPEKSYEDNFIKGPFGIFKDKKIYKNKTNPKYNVLKQKVHLPFGIAAGPLINSKFLLAALDKGFDIVTYKTVRTKKFACHPWPNVLSVHTKNGGGLALDEAVTGVISDHNFQHPISITNSFGVPSFDPDFWQQDLNYAVRQLKAGQIIVGSFQGTRSDTGDVNEYIKDYVNAARLVKKTGVKMLEINLSCPNEGTKNFLCFDRTRSKIIIESVKNEVGNIPLIVKLAYFENKKLLEELIKDLGGAVEAFATINTMHAKVISRDKKQALPERFHSGICGAAIRWAGLEMVKALRDIRERLSFSYAIIGVGGVASPEDYFAYRKAGADVVMSATGAMWNPYLAQEIKRKLETKKV